MSSVRFSSHVIFGSSLWLTSLEFNTWIRDTVQWICSLFWHFNFSFTYGIVYPSHKTFTWQVSAQYKIWKHAIKVQDWGFYWVYLTLIYLFLWHIFFRLWNLSIVWDSVLVLALYLNHSKLSCTWCYVVLISSSKILRIIVISLMF